MKTKTSELTGAALDWAVAVAEGYEAISTVTDCFDRKVPPHVCIAGWDLYPELEGTRFAPSTNRAQGWLIIEREKIETTAWGKSEWRARSNWNASYATWVHVTMFETFGPTPPHCRHALLRRQ